MTDGTGIPGPAGDAREPGEAQEPSEPGEAQEPSEPGEAQGPSEPGEIFSHSRLASFEQCPQKFQYRYRWKIPAESESIEGFVGKRVHEVLEKLQRSASRGRVPALPRVLIRYRQMFDDAYDPARVRIVREGTPLEFYRELGEHCLANYYHDHYPFDREQTLALEEQVSFSLDPDGRYRLQGFIDRIARAPDGAIEIQDYKTSARLPSQSDVNADRQLALYQIGVGARYGSDRPVRLVWHFLRQGRTLVSTRTPTQLRALADQTRALIDRIRDESVFAPRKSALCGWCEYREGCPASPGRREDRPLYTAPRRGERAARRRPAPPAPASDQLAFSFRQG